MPSNLPRKYRGTMSDVIEQGEKVEKHLLDAKKDFQAMFPAVFPDSKFIRFSNLLNLARSTPSDILLRGKISIHTAAVKKIIARFKKHHTRRLCLLRTARRPR